MSENHLIGPHKRLCGGRCFGVQWGVEGTPPLPGLSIKWHSKIPLNFIKWNVSFLCINLILSSEMVLFYNSIKWNGLVLQFYQVKWYFYDSIKWNRFNRCLSSEITRIRTSEIIRIRTSENIQFLSSENFPYNVPPRAFINMFVPDILMNWH